MDYSFYSLIRYLRYCLQKVKCFLIVFCILNNIAIGAKYLLKRHKYKRIAIVDFDVHHGNGTQDIFYDNEKVLYISSHQYPYYPGTGSEKEKGKFNNICNIPLPAGTNSEEYLNAFEFALGPLLNLLALEESE